MSRWIGLYWDWALPVLTTLATLALWRDMRAARRRELISRRGQGWMLASLAATQALIWLAWLAVVYQANPWLPAGGLAAIGLILVALRAARSEVHPGLRGFQRPPLRDGLEMIDRGLDEGRARHRLARVLRRWLPLLPALGLILYVAGHHAGRLVDFALLAAIVTAPLTLIPYRRQWLTPALLILPALVSISRAASLQAALPAGLWATPVTGARCAGAIHVTAARGQAWCVDPFSATVYRFHLGNGAVDVQTRVPEAVRILAANASRAWVQQMPARGLIAVGGEPDSATPVTVRNARSGAADLAGRLWVIDVGSELSVYSGQRKTTLHAKDGLLNSTATVVRVSPGGDVWVGSIGGISWRRAGQRAWQTVDRKSGLPGAVNNIAFAPDGTVWVIWQARPYGANANWGVSSFGPNGKLNHLQVGAPTGLEPPRGRDTLAADALGRLWFVTQSIRGREKLLGVVSPGSGSPPAIYSLGQYSLSGPFAYGTGLWEDSFGVVADGAGGIILFNADAQPWRHWRSWP